MPATVSRQTVSTREMAVFTAKEPLACPLASGISRPFLLFVTEEVFIGQLFDAYIFRKSGGSDRTSPFIPVILNRYFPSGDDLHARQSRRRSVRRRYQVSSNEVVFFIAMGVSAGNCSKRVAFTMPRISIRISRRANATSTNLTTSPCALNEWSKGTTRTFGSTGKVLSTDDR